jgi:hypothetical protein
MKNELPRSKLQGINPVEIKHGKTQFSWWKLAEFPLKETIGTRIPVKHGHKMIYVVSIMETNRNQQLVSTPHPPYRGGKLETLFGKLTKTKKTTVFMK